MNKPFLHILLAVVVFVAGCVNQGGTGGTGTASGSCGSSPGGASDVHVTNLKPDFHEFESGEQISLSFGIKNDGSLPARNIQYQLFGLSSAEWSISPGTRVNGATLLQPPDPSSSTKTGGEEDSIDWTLMHSVRRTVPVPYTVEARAYFEYESSSESNVLVATDNYLDSLPNERKESFKNTLGVTTSIPSKGPLTISIEARKKVINPANIGSPVRINVIIENKGAGIVSNGVGGTPNEITAVTILSGTRPIACSGISMSGVPAKLTGGKTKTFYCDLPTSTLVDSGYENIPLTAHLRYTYYVGQCTNLNVIPPS